MKSAWIFPLIFAAALPLFAQEPKNDPKSEPKKSADANKTAAAATAAPAETPATATAATPGGDSPLVAAARRANRRNRKASATVITNETLTQSGANAHVTTTEKQHQIRLPPPPEPSRPTPEMVHAQSAAKGATQQQRVAGERAKAQAEEDQKRAQKAAASEDGYNGGQGDDADELAAGSDQKPPMH